LPNIIKIDTYNFELYRFKVDHHDQDRQDRSDEQNRRTEV